MVLDQTPVLAGKVALVVRFSASGPEGSGLNPSTEDPMCVCGSCCTVIIHGESNIPSWCRSLESATSGVVRDHLTVLPK
ncbi:hypothetical protein AVEN_70852-1 [Araneus ventricosus]|uniref:Uncharacterized protein n=1 Tax=Araneus ventricosus TaxID=182803 RepID=A0A4Y2U1E6_ARAVE|nr:hypothetical protein AVEN_70852-1 [Araneus ventricosus]